MIESLTRGGTAGAVGTAVLNSVTFLDMAVRGRAPSEIPAQAAERTAKAARLQLGAEPAASHRRSGLGSLFGYLTGVGLGAAYGLVRSRLGRAPVPLAGAVLGVAAMAGANAPAIAMGLTDPRRWGTAGWLADLVPHAAFGLATAATFEQLRSPASEQTASEPTTSRPASGPFQKAIEKAEEES